MKTGLSENSQIDYEIGVLPTSNLSAVSTQSAVASTQSAVASTQSAVVSTQSAVASTQSAVASTQSAASTKSMVASTQSAASSTLSTTLENILIYIIQSFGIIVFFSILTLVVKYIKKKWGLSIRLRSGQFSIDTRSFRNPNNPTSSPRHRRNVKFNLFSFILFFYYLKFYLNYNLFNLSRPPICS